jgi:hypothetical protein
MNTTETRNKKDDHEEITYCLSANHTSTFITTVQPQEGFKAIPAFIFSSFAA